jgi:hypothetical protein
MNEKTLVYGLGKEYQENQDWVAAHFNVTGYCDQDVSRMPTERAVRKEELKKRLAEFDFVLVTADPVSIVADLIEEFSVPLAKIRVLYYELAQREIPLRTFYGENAEDAVLMLLCREIGLSFEGLSYLEIGTNDPVRFNNTYNLYRLGARGLLVDPLPAVAELIHMSRPEDRFLHAAVSAVSGPQQVFFASKSSLVSSLSYEHHKAWDGITHNEVREIPVNVFGINEVVEQMGTVPDLLLVDAEGEDEKIMRAFDYTRFHPKIIMVEMDHLDSSRVEMMQFIESHGYIEYATVAYNTIFVGGEEWENHRR